MKTMKLNFALFAAFSVIATGLISTPAAADLEVVAVMAMQPRVSVSEDVFLMNAEKETLAEDFAAAMKPELNDRLADEFETARRSAKLASDFSEQILDALDERLPGEVDNLIAAVN